ncbi:glutamate receptor ionotropic, kainate 2 isoform X2 [Cephus cinctus]|nr:glutamate receptor ionotropic, kainate 2 isoform X2 [Cephus cinctus]
MDIPHITTRWDGSLVRETNINIYPHAKTYSMAFYNIILELNWKSFILLYENSDSLIRSSELIKDWEDRQHSVTLRQLGSGPDYKDVLRKIKKSDDFNIVVDCALDVLPELLTQAQQIGIITERYSFVFTTLDLQTLDLESFQYSGANFTGVRLLDPEDSYVKKKFELHQQDWGVSSPSDIKTEAALMYDAVQVFAKAFKQFKKATIKPDEKKLYCNETLSWEHGNTLSNFIRLTEMRGLTGLIKFDTAGFLSNIQLDIIKLTTKGLTKVGYWNSTSGIEWIPQKPDYEDLEQSNLFNKTFIVLVSLTDPYVMLKESSQIMTGNDRYEGFAIDIIAELSKVLHFNYTFELQKDTKYGSKNPETGEWDGMIGKIQKDEADLAITDLTITSERESGADFTKPFMLVGISILYRKPTSAPPSLFSFLSPFSKEVWLYLIGAYLLVSLLLFIIGRMSPAEWNNPYPCIADPEELENQFSLVNALWFTIGSIMQQGSEIAPISISTRMIAGSWWFFCLIMVSSYTANLAAFLTVENPMKTIENAEQLANQKVIKYGAKRDGSTLKFFRDSMDPNYHKMYTYMSENAAEVLMKTNDDGVKKVLDENDNYAFLMESTSIDYIAERRCNVTKVNGNLDNKGYGIAMKKNAPYRNILSSNVLKLQESGFLKQLEIKWWKEKRGGGKCDEDSSSSGEASELGLANVGGVFLVLAVGIFLSCFYTAWELLWDIGCTAWKENLSFKEELKDEMKFIVKCSGTTKPVRRRKDSSNRSDEDSTRGCTPPYEAIPTVITTLSTDDL